MVYKMIVLLCSLTATPNLDACTERTAISMDRLTRVAPSADRCSHDSQHEQAQILYRDIAKGGNPKDRKIKVLCIPSN